MTTKKGRGRPQYVPTDDEREKVQILRAQGMSKEAIAEALGIHFQTLNTHFSMDMDVAVAKKTAEVMLARYRSALGGSVPAQNKFLELAGAIPPKTKRVPTAPKLGKKEIAQIEAEQIPDGDDWGKLLQ